jgi:hypothetical protein
LIGGFLGERQFLDEPGLVEAENAYLGTIVFGDHGKWHAHLAGEMYHLVGSGLVGFNVNVFVFDTLTVEKLLFGLTEGAPGCGIDFDSRHIEVSPYIYYTKYSKG